MNKKSKCDICSSLAGKTIKHPVDKSGNWLKDKNGIGTVCQNG